MTVSTQENIVKYQGNPSTTIYQIPFRWLEDTDINIKKQLQDGTVEVLTYLTDYTLTGGNDEHGGYATFTVAPLETDTIVIQRIVPYTQETDYEENEIFPADSHEEALDKLTMEVQQLAEESSRSLKISVFSTVDPEDVINHVERVYQSVDNIDNVAKDLPNVDTVGENIESVNTTARDIDSVVTTATNIKDVNTVAQNKASINVTAANINDIKTVSSIKGNIQTVAANNTNITKVGTNISSVNTAASNMEAIKNAPTAASNAAKSAANAANSARISANSAIWAEGTDAQVQALGGVHSSKGWAEQSTSVNISLTNSPYTTNRILEIPQDIKLELNNGTLTLKAGSKVYVPNGTGVFDAVTVPNDVVFQTGAIGSSTIHMMFCCNLTGGFGARATPDYFVSGSTAPSNTAKFWYDTTNNAIKVYEGGSWVRKYSLPIGIYYRENGNVVSIDQVFNGFGYIGSTVFALPGVKVQIPNGRNEDGTCRSIIATVDSVKTITRSDSLTTSMHWYLLNDLSAYASTIWSFDADKNIYVSSQLADMAMIEFAGGYLTSGRITSFEPFTVDSVVNSNLSNLSATGQAKFDAKANVSNTVTTDTNQTISGSKRFTKPSNGFSIELLADTNQQTVPTSDTTNYLSLYRNTTYTKGDGHTGWIYTARTASGITRSTLNVRRFLEGDSQQILNYISAEITADGTPISYTKTPPIYVSNEQIITAAWFNTKMQVVSALPAAPNANVFYFIPE